MRRSLAVGRRRAPRGQAAVELALGSLVLVTILVVGIHFAEFGFLWVKLEEAANFALFDETNRKMHDTYANTWNDALNQRVGGAVSGLNSDTDKRYRDFDGLSSATGGSTVTQVFTRGSRLAADCARYQGPTIDLKNPKTAVIRPAYGAADRENAGMDCQVSASLSTFRFPTHFADGKRGFFGVKTIDAKLSSPTACAAGRPKNGSCTGHGFRIVLDDWGFQGTAEARECHLTSSGDCDNTAYYRMAKATYTAAGGSNGTASSTFARDIAGFAPTSETPFWMSFRGSESQFTETHPSDGSTRWPTTPYNDPNSQKTYRPAYQNNRACFLGWKC